MHIAQLGDVGLADLVEGRGGQDQDRGVDQQRKAERDGGIDGREFYRLALLLDRLAEAARLHHARMQEQIVRHHGRADDADRQIEHVRILHDLDRRREADDHRAPIRIGHRDLDREADRDHAEQRHDQRFDITEAEILHPQDQKHVERGDQHAQLKWNAEQEIEPDRGADHFGKVGCADRDLGDDPQRP